MSAIATLERAALDLAAALEAETRALAARDLAAAATLGGAKQAALEAFLAARAAIPPEALRPVAADLALLVDRLRAGVEANRAMLQQALAVQARVIETMARAAGQAASATQGYGPAGTAGAAPLALSLRA